MGGRTAFVPRASTADYPGMLTEEVFERVEDQSSLVEADVILTLPDRSLESQTARAIWAILGPALDSPDVRSIDIWAKAGYSDDPATAGFLLFAGEASRKLGKMLRIRTA